MLEFPSHKRMRQFLAVCVVLVILWPPSSEARCGFAAIFNFGDSNSDTGGFFAAFPAQPLPNGMTFFKKPTGRQTDGRLVIDFLAQALGLPFLSPYLQSIGSDYKHGANFATSSATVLLPKTSLFVTGVSPFSLAIQLNQMKQFKAQVDQQHYSRESKLPSPDIFGKSLYTINIGQNDFTPPNLKDIGIGGVKSYLPQVVSQISDSIKDLYYNLGGRTFMVFNLAPIGCLPTFLVRLPHDKSDVDAFGCMKSINSAVIDFNNMLKKAVRETRLQLPGAHVIYVDVHSVLLELYQRPRSHGLLYGSKACCGYGGGAHNFDTRVWCGYSNVVNGQKIEAKACADPQNYVNWDGVHSTEAANKLVAEAILNGSLFDPPFSLAHFCDIHPIG